MRTELKLQAVIAFITVLLTGSMMLLMIRFKDFHSVSVELSKRLSEGNSYSVLSFLRERDEVETVTDVLPDEMDSLISIKDPVAGEAMKHDLAMELPAETDLSKITFSSDPEGKTFLFRVPGINENYFSEYLMAGNSSGISDIKYEFRDDFGMIELSFEKITEVEHVTVGRFLCLDYLTPHEYYDRVIVIDAGHGGGGDPGATKQGISEKDINLSIMLKIKEAFKDEIESRKIGVYCTRQTDVGVKLKDRSALANDLSADLFLSVHCNSTASGRMSDFSGTQVLYHVSDKTGGSKAFAEVCLKHLTEALQTKDRGIVAADQIYIIRTAEVPVALCEIGFMTNKEELYNLTNDGFQQKAANALHEAVLEMLSKEDNENE